jgi:hypothetical protein
MFLLCKSQLGHAYIFVIFCLKTPINMVIHKEAFIKKLNM